MRLMGTSATANFFSRHRIGRVTVPSAAGVCLSLFAAACSEPPLAPNPVAAVAGPSAVLITNIEVHDLGALGAGPESIAFAINSAGEVVGQSEFTGEEDGPERGFVVRNDKIIDLGALPGANESKALAINTWGDIVGVSNKNADPGSPDVAVIWKNGTIMRLIGLAGDASTAYGINDAGQIVGGAENHDGYEHAVLWENGGIRDLGTLGGTSSTAYGINSRGDIVGVSGIKGDVADHAFLWRHGKMFDLGTLGGTNSSARAINDKLEIVGISDVTGNSEEHAFFWSRVNDVPTMKDIGPEGFDSFAFGISSNSKVAGYREDDFGQETAFYWSAGELTYLPNVGGTSTNIHGEGHGINPAGTIVVGYSDTSIDQHAALWKRK